MTTTNRLGLGACVLLWGVATSAFGAAKDADIYRFAAPAAWIEPARADYQAQAPEGDLSDGSWLLMLDRQTDVNAQGDERYVHVAIKVTNAEGIQRQSQIDLSVDPSYQTLAIHSLRVVRNGTAIDQRSKARITALPEETEREQHIYNGRYNVDIVLADVRVGDVVEYEYSRRSTEQFMTGHFADRMSVGWADPTHWQRVRVRYPVNRPMHYRFSSNPIAPESRQTGDHAELSFQWKDLAAIHGDDERPSWFDPWPVLEFTDLPDWAAVTGQIDKLFALPERPRPSLEAALTTLQVGSDSPEQKVMKALRFVQENIRYTSISIGRGSYTPTDPETVLNRRFGDCKDKSLLLATLLRRLGIEAHPALVHTEDGPMLTQSLPSPYIFDHAIVRAQIGDAVYWLDGTSYPQHSALQTLEPADFSYALPLGVKAAALESIPKPQANARGREIEHTFDFSKGLHSPATLDVVSRYKGHSADYIRSRLSRQSTSERQADYLNYYARYYPGIKETAAMSIADDTSTNILETHEHYIVEKVFSGKPGGKESFTLQTDEMYKYGDVLKNSVRTSPLSVNFPDHVRQTIIARMPEDWPIRKETTQIDNPAFRYRSDTSSDGRTVKLVYEYEALADHVDVADLQQYVADRAKLDDDVMYKLSYTPAKPATKNTSQRLAAIAPTPLFAALISFGLSIWLMWRFVYRYDPPPKVALAGAKNGFGGWLSLPALRCIVSPILLLYVVDILTRYVDDSVWQVLPTIVAVQYADWAHPTLLALVIIGALLIPFSVTVSLLFFGKRTSAPILFVTQLLLATAYSILVDVIRFNSGIKNITASDQQWEKIVYAIIFSIIWFAYMLKSERVKATFINRLSSPPQRQFVAPTAVSAYQNNHPQQDDVLANAKSQDSRAPALESNDSGKSE